LPIFEYVCESCGQEFEALVRKASTPVCPSCGASRLDKRLSLPSVKSETTKARSLKAAKQRDKKQGTERVQEQIRYEQNHD